MAISAYNSRFINPSTNAELTPTTQPVKGEIQTISFSGISAAEIDVTNLSSSAKAYVLGTMDGGTVEVTAFMSTGANLQPTLPTSGASTPTDMKVIFGNADGGNDGVTLAFSAYVQNTAMEASVDGAVQVTYTLRISGAVTVAYLNRT
jgi:hypothetical protein